MITEIHDEERTQRVATSIDPTKFRNYKINYDGRYTQLATSVRVHVFNSDPSRNEYHDKNRRVGNITGAIFLISFFGIFAASAFSSSALVTVFIISGSLSGVLGIFLIALSMKFDDGRSSVLNALFFGRLYDDVAHANNQDKLRANHDILITELRDYFIKAYGIIVQDSILKYIINFRNYAVNVYVDMGENGRENLVRYAVETDWENILLVTSPEDKQELRF